jgi:Ca-activated chloride channel homolog
MLIINPAATTGVLNSTPSFPRSLLKEIFLILFALALFTVAGVLAAAAVEPRLVSLSDIRSGGLLLKAKTPGKYVEAPRLQTDIDVKVTGVISRTIITQRFKNPSTGWVEGIYVFPMPENAAVDTLKMQIGDRFIEGLIKERKEAKRIYEKAKSAGKKASLIEQERPNMFTNSIANIGPGETVIVQMEYQETVARNKGVFSLRIPLVTAPRYVPKPLVYSVKLNSDTGMGQVGFSDPVPDRNRIVPPVAPPGEGVENPVTLNISLDAGFPIDKLVSPSHRIAIKTKGDNSAIINLAKGETPANKDFVVSWQATAGLAPTAALFREKVGEDEYLLAIVTPPRPAADSIKEKTKIPREIIFVVDNSGSMAGPSIRQARQALLRALDRLTLEDRFNIIRFDDTMEELFPNSVRGIKENLDTAKRFIRNLEAEGGTEMLPALKAALVDASPNDTSTVRQVVFLTDGAIGNETQLFEEIKRNRGRSRIFTVGIGSAPNSFFMTRAAEYGRGSFTYIGSVKEVAKGMTKLFEKLENPVMTDLAANWQGANVTDITPAILPDLYTGEPVIIAARMKKVSGRLALSGNLAGQPWLINLPLDKAATGKGIGKLWARRKINDLEGQRLNSQDWKKFDAQILQTALAHHLVSRLTSLVAVDLTPSRAQGEPLATRNLPLQLPEGWNFDKVFGPSDPLMQKATVQQNNPARAKQFAQLVSSSPTRASAIKTRPKGIALPAGGTLADQKILMGLLILFMAFSSLLVIFFWQHLGRSYGQTKIARPSYDL